MIKMAQGDAVSPAASLRCTGKLWLMPCYTALPRRSFPLNGRTPWNGFKCLAVLGTRGEAIQYMGYSGDTGRSASKVERYRNVTSERQGAAGWR